MKTSVRFLSLLLAVLMIAGLALTASAKETETNANNEALQLVVDLGIIEGYDDGSLQPEKLVERDEMAKIIFVLYTTFKDAGAGTVAFKDVPADDWSAGYISWCSSMGIIGGYGNGNFGPNDNVTYDQALKMVCGALGYKDWDPLFWPTDVRQVALTTLNLGENLTDVKGSDKLTRAQVAQIVCNALFADMKETKSEPVKFGELTVYLPTPKTLATDVWKFGDVTKSVTAAGNTGLALIADQDKYDVTIDGIGDFSLEELGLEEYANKLSDLMYSRVRIIYDAKNVDKVADLEAEDILAVSVIETVEKDVAVTYDEDEAKFYINGEEIDANAKTISVDSDGKITETAFDHTNTNLKEIVEEEYNAKFMAYDLDEDGDYDRFYCSVLNAYEVKAVNKDKISVTLYGDANYITVKNENLVTAAALEEEDVAIMYKDYANVVVESVVEPITGTATKWNSKALTIKDQGEFKINEKIFFANNIYKVEKNVMDLNDKGQTASYDYYVYNGYIFGGNVTASTTALNFGILSYIVKPEADELDEDTMTLGTSYKALITIDGKEQTVVLDPDDIIDGKGKDEIDDILALYGIQYTDDGSTYAAAGKYLVKRYILVSYKVDENGRYSLDTTPESPDYINFGQSVLTYGKESGLYTIAGTTNTNKALFDDTVELYYTYTEKSTGHYVYLGSYTIDNLPADISEITTLSDVFAVIDEETGFYMIKMAVIDNESIKLDKGAEADFRTDARQIFYSYRVSNIELADNGKDTYVSYFFKPLLEANLAETLDTTKTVADGATEAIAGGFYGWDEATEKYVQIKKSTLSELGVTSFDLYTLDDIVKDVIFIENDGGIKGVKVPADVHVWAPNNSSTLSSHSVKSLDWLSEIFEAVEESGQKMQIFVGTYEDENGDEVICDIFSELWVIDEDDVVKKTTSGNTAFTVFVS